jgi:hypothetical protein
LVAKIGATAMYEQENGFARPIPEVFLDGALVGKNPQVV